VTEVVSEFSVLIRVGNGHFTIPRGHGRGFMNVREATQLT